MKPISYYRSVSAILRLWSLVRVGSFQMDLRMYLICVLQWGRNFIVAETPSRTSGVM